MMRRALVTQVGGYKPSMWTATDYELFARLLQVTEIANLPTILTAYRRSATQISSRNHKMQSGQVILFLLAFVYERLGLRVTLSDISAFYYGVRHEPLDSQEGVEAAAKLLNNIYARFVAITPMSDDEEELVRQDCAWRYLVLAHSHRPAYRAISRQLFAQSLALDPQILQRPKARTWLRTKLKLT